MSTQTNYMCYTLLKLLSMSVMLYFEVSLFIFQACVKKINRLKSREEEIKNLLDSDAAGVSEEMEKQHLKQLNEVEALKKGSFFRSAVS